MRLNLLKDKIFSNKRNVYVKKNFDNINLHCADTFIQHYAHKLAYKLNIMRVYIHF